jgi:hypothetical protein
MEDISLLGKETRPTYTFLQKSLKERLVEKYFWIFIVLFVSGCANTISSTPSGAKVYNCESIAKAIQNYGNIPEAYGEIERSAKNITERDFVGTTPFSTNKKDLYLMAIWIEGETSACKHFWTGAIGGNNIHLTKSGK